MQVRNVFSFDVPRSPSSLDEILKYINQHKQNRKYTFIFVTPKTPGAICSQKLDQQINKTTPNPALQLNQTNVILQQSNYKGNLKGTQIYEYASLLT